MLQSLSINISRRLLCCLRATNKLWMLIRKGQYSANQNKLRGGRHKRGANKNEKGKEKKKALIRAEQELKSQGNQWPGQLNLK